MTGNPRRCVCPGSYDPITMGHVDVITRASALYDEVVVAVLGNPDKRDTFSHDERVELIRQATSHLTGVRAASFGARLIVDVCREVDAGVILKGIRGEVDYGYELPMALMNREMTGVETVFLPADPALSHYSSSLIRQIAGYGGDVAAMVPEAVLQPLTQRLREGGS
ncbi:pantetheine-phosphate adenylyltransferase [Leekyejoonella antrihumi]|uniref:Phosphopantetheine adenylyltransferase n=1 Tax=Leekyejoonella antrihumi TaxID=1660198 RepID=A0A563DSQ9_9MICO|nr:pantetheine-phosphate adenylyltransferase [Leekyejoonella antrihumi]TWP33023.1 pantetheine-phosphate adenylyltransferase [Leekyejoonella antrihumi]